MKRRAAACSALCLVALAVACRQIVGINDRTLADSGAGATPSCGALALPASACSSCVAQSCCSEATACAANAACAAFEECVIPCGTDPHCLHACNLANPIGPGSEVVALDTCLATSCATPCQLVCGAREHVAPGDASVPCTACVAANVCSQQLACMQSVPCQMLGRCVLSCATLDCAIACNDPFDAGLAAWNTYIDQLGSCSSECNQGQAWDCIGKVSWPHTKAGALSLATKVVDLLDSSPTAGADVKLCSKNDPQCAQPLDEQTTGADGSVLLHYSLASYAPGLDGYLQISSPDTALALFFWNFPLTEPNARVGASVNTIKSASLPGLFAATGITPVAGHGHAGVVAFDCSHATADGVQLHITSGSDANTKVLYAAASGGLSVNADRTTSSGLAFIANLVAGTVSIDVVPVSVGQPSSHVSFLVRDGAVEQIFAIPTP